MVETKNKCYKCKNFDRYYTKEEKHFQRTACGWCYKKQENVSSSEACEMFIQKRVGKRPKRALLMYLHDLLMEISEVRKLIEDDKFDDDENM